jgi:hypothetical protein
MNLIELVDLLRNPDVGEKTISEQFPGLDLDQIDVYMRSALDTGSTLRLLNAEAIPNQLEILLEGVSYVNLFPLYMVREFIDDYLGSIDESATSAEIARRMILYRLKDA